MVLSVMQRRIVGLHQITSIRSTNITDTWLFFVNSVDRFGAGCFLNNGGSWNVESVLVGLLLVVTVTSGCVWLGFRSKLYCEPSSLSSSSSLF